MRHRGFPAIGARGQVEAITDAMQDELAADDFKAFTDGLVRNFDDEQVGSP